MNGMYDEECAFGEDDDDAQDEMHEVCSEELQALRASVREAEHKLAILDAIRRLLEERGGEGELFTLFSSLLDQAADIRAEADRLADRIALLEDELSQAKWEAQHSGAYL